MTWTYTYRCRACSSTYDVHFDEVLVGPVGMNQVIGKDRSDSGIEILKTRPLYDGKLAQITCSECRFSCKVCSDLDPPTTQFFVTVARRAHPEIDFDVLFEAEGRRLRDFPLLCPCCGSQVLSGSDRKRCVHCGSSQINIIDSAGPGRRGATEM